MAERMLNDKDRIAINKDLRELEEHQAEIQKAIDAKVPKAEETLDICLECKTRLEALKQQYFPNKR